MKKLKLDASDISYHKGTRDQAPLVRVKVRELDATPSASSKTSSTAKLRATAATDLHTRATALLRALPEIPVTGYPQCSRAVITEEGSSGLYRVLVEGYGLRAVLGTTGVDWRGTETNSVLETKDVLGIEAARACITKEMALVLRDMDIDPRHLALLADVMTQKGEVLGITRFGLARMRDSVLQLASFEKTSDHLFDAATSGATDRVEGVSECVIMGQSMGMGTGGFGLVRALAVDREDLEPKPTVFEETFQAMDQRERIRQEKAKKEAASRNEPIRVEGRNGEQEDHEMIL